MREARRTRSIISERAIREACEPKRHEPLKPGKERASSIPGLPGLQVIEVVSETDS